MVVFEPLSIKSYKKQWLKSFQLKSRIKNSEFSIVVGTVVFAKPDALKGSLSETIAQHRPHVLIGVPRVYEKMQASIEKLLMQQNGLARWAISKCLDKVLLANECAMQGLPEPWGSYAAKRIVEEIKRRAGMDRIVYALSGGAPLLEDTQKFWLKLNIPICQGWFLMNTNKN